MIYNDSPEAILEAAYLEDSITREAGRYSVRVNPKDTPIDLNYIIKKTVILNDPYSTIPIIETLGKGMNTVIGRVSYNSPLVKFQPYITKINKNVMWNGEILHCPPEIKTNSREILRWIGKEIITGEGGNVTKIFFPKICGIDPSAVYDSLGNINILGWVLHQVGINTDKKTKFVDLDLLKTEKVVF